MRSTSYNLKDGKRITRLAPDFVGEAAIWGKREQSWFFATLTSFTNPSLLYQYRFDDALKEGEKWKVAEGHRSQGSSSGRFRFETGLV
jgi:prolyl oligopeptidase